MSHISFFWAHMNKCMNTIIRLVVSAYYSKRFLRCLMLRFNHNVTFDLCLMTLNAHLVAYKFNNIHYDSLFLFIRQLYDKSGIAVGNVEVLLK